MTCVWGSLFAPPVCSGPSTSYDAPSIAFLRAGSVLDACGTTGTISPILSAACEAGAWAVADRDVNVTVTGVGAYRVYIPAALPAFVSMPEPTSAGRSYGSVIRVAVPNTAYTSSVVSLAPPILRYQSSVGGWAAKLRSNATSDAILMQATITNATILTDSSPPSSASPGNALFVWPDIRSVPIPLAAVPGVPDGEWSSSPPVTIVTFASDAYSIRVEAESLVSSLRIAGVFLGQLQTHTVAAPPPPELTSLQITTKDVGAYVSLAASSAIVLSFVVTLYKCRQGNRDKSDKNAADPKTKNAPLPTPVATPNQTKQATPESSATGGAVSQPAGHQRFRLAVL